MKRWRLYPIYKPSGIEWLGEIPEHWSIKKVKSLAKNKADITQTGPFGAQLHASDYMEEGIPLILIKNVNGHKIDPTDIPKISEEKASELVMYRLKPGDIVFSRVGTIGRIALVAEREEGWLISGQMLRLRINSSEITNEFAVYAIDSDSVLNYFEVKSVGSTRDSINTEILRNLILPLPPLDEQHAIINYLDRETARIDALVATKEHFIELLAEKRIALISQAVTKGLDPDVPLKDSGVEWLGEIPEHWEVKRLKHIARINLNTLTEGTEPDYVIKYIDIGNVGENGLLAEPEKMIFGNAPSRARRIIKKDNVIISTVRTYLKAIAHFPNPEDNLVCSTGFAVLEPGNLIIPRFLYYLAHCDKFIETIMAYSVGLGYPAINTSVFAGFPVWLPTISEQETIAGYLDRETAKIDSLITKTRESIEKLKEYRTALVSAAVTGKIDVREEAP